MAASSAAMSLEYVCYNLLNSFSQACTTFVGQNHGARQIDRCTKTLKVCLVEGGIVALTTIIVIVGLGREILVAVQQRSQHRLDRLYPRVLDLPGVRL